MNLSAQSMLSMYHLTLKPASGIEHAVVGSFSGGKTQEIIVARNSRIELLRPDTATGRLHSVLSHNTFSTIRSIVAFRLTGGTKGK